MIFTDNPEIDPTLRADDLPGSFLDSMAATARQALYNSPIEQIQRTVQDSYASDTPMVDYETARTKAHAAGVDIQIDPKGMTEGALNLLIDRKRTQARIADAISRGPQGAGVTAAQFVVGMGASMLDPINLASAFIPVARLVGMERQVAQAGIRGAEGAGLTALQRTSARVKVGAVEGAVGQAMLEPLTAYRASQEQEDYTITDTLLNIGFGAALGAVAHSGLGALGDRAAARQIEERGRAIIDAAKTAPDSAAAKLRAADMETNAAVMRAEVVAAADGRKMDSSVLLANQDGTPLTVYHGSPAFSGEWFSGDGPHFFSTDPGVASHFAVNGSKVQGKLALQAAAQEDGRFTVTVNGAETGRFKTRKEAEAVLESAKESFAGLGANASLSVRELPEVNYSPEVIPAYLSVRNVFDPKNASHVAQVAKTAEDASALRKGDWNSLNAYLDDIKAAGFDGFYETEFGSRNIGVFDASNIKSTFGEAPQLDPAKIQQAAAASHLPENDVHFDAQAKQSVDEAMAAHPADQDPAEAVNQALQEATTELATLSKQLGMDVEKNAAMKAADETASMASKYSKAVEALATCQMRT